MARAYESRYPSQRYRYAICIPERVDLIKRQETDDEGPWIVEVLENPEEVALWLHMMGLVNDVDEVTSELKKWESIFMPGPQFSGDGRLSDHIVTDLGKELVRGGDPPNRYRQAWDEWKKLRATVEAVNSDTVVGTRVFEKLGSESEDVN